MRLLVDESSGPAVARWLRSLGHEVFSVYDEARGMKDEAVIRKASLEDWILITNDKDFGEKVYRERYKHRGIILLRLENERTLGKIDTLKKLFKEYPDQLADHFVVVTERQVRFARVSERID